MLIAAVLFLSFITPKGAAGDGNHLDAGFTIHLRRADAAGNFSKLELLERAARRSHHRMSRLSSLAAAAGGGAGGSGIQSPVHAGNGEFLMDLAVGTPPASFSAIADTGSDLIWTQCDPCVSCFDQPTPIFDPSASSTFKKLPCSGELCSALPTSSCNLIGGDCEYLYTYGDSSSTAGVLATETFTLAAGAKVNEVAFGCGDTNQGAGFSQGSGLVGLGRGSLSLLSQLKINRFSYCLTTLDSSATSPLSFGAAATTPSTSQSTPLVSNPSQPSFYYVSLTGITVGGTKLAVPSSAFAIRTDGTGGVIIDSGTSITYLAGSAYRALKKAFAAQMTLPVADGSGVGLDLCFAAPATATSVEVPKLTFHFDGGADLDLPAENYLVGDSQEGLLCLTVMGSRGLSIIGNFQQQNFQFVYDVAGERLSFAPAACDKL